MRLIPRRWLAVGAGLLALWVGVSSPRAELTISADVGFDGFYVPGEWTPVEVVLSNMPSDTDTHPPVDYEGFVSVLSQSYDGRPFTYIAPVNLPGNSLKHVWLVVKAAAPQLSTPPTLTVEFRATNRRGRVVTDVQGRPAPPGSSIVLAVRDPGAPETLRLPGVTGSQSYTLASVTQIPDQWAALSSVSAIFLTRGAAVRLTQSQVDSLSTWVERGGLLVVDGGGGSSLSQSALADLLPVATTERATWVLQRGNRFVRVPEGTDPLPVGSAVLLAATAKSDADVLWAQGPDQVLAASRPVGLGRIAFVAWDLSNTAMSENSRALAVLTGLMPPPGAALDHDTFHQLVLQNIAPDPSIATPSLLLVFVLLVGYWLVVGPGNYFWLRQRRRIEWSWVTLPAIIAVFCVVFYGIGYLTRSNKDSLRHINVAFARPGIPVARTDGISLHFSATKQRVDFAPSRPDSALSQIAFWEMAMPSYGVGLMNLRRAGMRFPQPGFGMPSGTISALRDINDPTSVTESRDEGMQLEGQLLRQWSLAYLESSGPGDLGGVIRARCHYSLDAGGLGIFQLAGEITNATNLNLRRCAILWGQRYFPLTPGDLGPGQSVSFVAPWSQAPTPQSFQFRSSYDNLIDSRDSTHIRLAALRAVMLDDVDLPWLNPRSGVPYLVAFTDKALLAPTADRDVERPPDTTLLLVELPIEVAAVSRFVLDSACLPVTYSIHAATDDAVDMSGDYNQNRLLQMHDSQIIVTYRLPWAKGVRSQVEAVRASLNFTDSANQWVRLYELDRTATGGNPWIEVPTHLTEGGANAGLPLGAAQNLDASRVVDPLTGEITLMIVAEPRPESPQNYGVQRATINFLTLTVEGRVWPEPAAQPNTPAEEIAS